MIRIVEDVAKYTDGQVTYTGFDKNDNGICFIETRGDWTYITYQKNEWSTVIFGYIVANVRGSEKWKYIPREQREMTGYYAFKLSDESDLYKDRKARMFSDWQEAVDYMIERCSDEYTVREVIYR